LHGFFYFWIKYNALKNIASFLIVFGLFFSCQEKGSISNSESILTSDFSKLSASKKNQYLDSVSVSLKSIEEDTLQIKFLFEVAAEYYYLKNNKSSFQSSKRIFELSEKINDSISMGRALYYMGDCFEDYQKDSAYYYYKESEKIFRAINDDEKIAKALFNKAHLLFSEGNYVESEVEVMKALQKLTPSKKHTFLYKCYYLQAANHTELEEYDGALSYLNLAQKHLNLAKPNINVQKFNSYTALAVIAFCNIYDKKGDYKSSIVALEKLATEDLKMNHPKLYATVLGNLAYANMQLGRYEVAHKKFKESIALSKLHKHTQGYLYKIIHFGEYHLRTQDTLTATLFFNEALPLAKQLKSSSELLKTLQFLAVSDVKRSTFYKDEYVRVNDSIVKQQRLNREKFARIEYETNKVTNANKTLTYNNLLLVLGLVFSILVFLTVLIIRNQLARKKEQFLIRQKELADDELLDLIKSFQYELVQAKEEEQSRISKELHDGIVNQIYAIRMVLGTLNDDDDELTKEKRAVYIKELHKVESEIRSLSHELYTDFSIYDSNYLFLIHSLVKSNNAFKGTVFKTSIAENIDWNYYSSIVKINLYRMLQELFLNVNKYAKASVCSLVIHETTDFLHIKVEDDGVGFDNTYTVDGIGLKNIKDRVKALNALISVESELNKGVAITIKIKKDL